MACLRLLTFPPLPPRPLRAVPRLLRCISLFTSLLALRDYLRFRFAIGFSDNYLDHAKAVVSAPAVREVRANELSCHCHGAALTTPHRRKQQNCEVCSIKQELLACAR
jgi:hypothetical protein